MKHEQFDLDAAADSFKRLLNKLRKNNVDIQQFGSVIANLLTEEEALKLSDSISLYYSGDDNSTALKEDSNA